MFFSFEKKNIKNIFYIYDCEYSSILYHFRVIWHGILS